jgi:hypothetical protein
MNEFDDDGGDATTPTTSLRDNAREIIATTSHMGCMQASSADGDDSPGVYDALSTSSIP